MKLNTKDLKFIIESVINNLNEWNSRKKYFGGNSGYQGYSKSNRAVAAEENGLKNKSQINVQFISDIINYIKQETNETIKLNVTIVKKELDDITPNEWHHTSKFGNRTNYYSIERIGDYFIKKLNLQYIENDNQIEEPIQSTTANNSTQQINNNYQENDEYQANINAQIGDKIKHEIFGEGIIIDKIDRDGIEIFVCDFNGNQKKLIKQWAKLKIINENIINEMAYPASFDMRFFKNLNNFSKRMKYCDQHLKKLSSGSGRIVYIIDDEKVLKLAKNNKGVAQNEVESEYYIQQSYSVAAKVFDTDDKGTFVEMELARKLTRNQFKQIVGFDFSLLDPYLTRRFTNRKSWKDRLLTPEIMEMLDENEWLYELGSIVGDYDMPIGDVIRLNSYGIVKRNGQDDVVLIDFGLTNGVYNDYYARK